MAISERLRQYPARDGLVFTTREGGLLNRNYCNRHVLKPALHEAGVEPTRQNGMHSLRHHHASVSLEGGVSIRRGRLLRPHRSGGLPPEPFSNRSKRST